VLLGVIPQPYTYKPPAGGDVVEVCSRSPLRLLPLGAHAILGGHGYSLTFIWKRLLYKNLQTSKSVLLEKSYYYNFWCHTSIINIF